MVVIVVVTAVVTVGIAVVFHIIMENHGAVLLGA